MNDNDGFWAIALDDNHRHEWQCRDDDDESEEVDTTIARAVTYRIPNLGDDGSQAILRLRPLPPSDGIWSHVGADAWYSSALLASLLLSKPDEENHESFRHPFTTMFASRSPNKSTCNTILELGSGAVGLSGFVCALALQQQLNSMHLKNNKSKWKVLLTDNENPVLEQLQNNLDQNQSTILPYNATIDVQVASWDWNDDHPTNGLLPTDEVVLVIGSELVYTRETADACVNLLLRLLEQYPSVEIWIIQVTDRFGWSEIVIPTLLKNQICVDSVPIPIELHDLAATMIPMGGTLDRHSFGAYCFHNKYAS